MTLKNNRFILFRLQRITRRQGGGSAGVYYNTSRKQTTQPTKLAEASEMVLQKKEMGGLVRASHEEGRFKNLLVVLLSANHTRYS